MFVNVGAETMMAVAIFSFVIAVLIGAWRQMCCIYENKLPYNLASLWRNTGIRIGSWMLTAILSIIFAFICASWIIANVGDFIGKFSFGVLLVTRWFASMFIGAFPAIKHCKKVLGDI